MFYGPFESEWSRLLGHLDRWLKELTPTKELTYPDGRDPWKVFDWLTALERKSADQVEDAAAKLAQFPLRQIPRLSGGARLFLKERIRLVRYIVEAIATTDQQAREPLALFGLQRYEGLEQQQVGWALGTYWREHGRLRWQMEQMNLIFYAARCQGWRPEPKKE